MAAPPQRKGLRTRERLRIGTAVALERKGFHDLAVADIAAAAGASPAAFYCYFRDKADAATQVLRPFAGLLYDTASLERGANAQAELTGAFHRIFAVARANPGLVRACEELRDEAPSWSTLMDLQAQAWHRGLARVLLSRHPAVASAPRASADDTADVLAALTDGLVRRAARCVLPGREVHALVGIWLRALSPQPKPARAALASAA